METSIIVQDSIKENAELSIIQSIYEIRGVRVMLDFDLAKRYEIETKRLKESVKRNIERFPSDFMFQLSKEEWKSLRSQIATSNRGGIRYMPIAFTQEGVAMLSGVLHSQKAIEENINIMRAFVAMRQYILGVAELKRELEEFMRKTNLQFNEIYNLLEEFFKYKKEQEKPRTPIGFKQKNHSPSKKSKKS